MKRFFQSLLVMILMLGLGVNGFAKKRDNFRIRLLYQGNEMINLKNPQLSDHNVWKSKNIESCFGDWDQLELSEDSNYGWLWTKTELDYKIGDTISLQQRRSINTNKVNKRFGLAAEVRIWKDIWVGTNFLQTPVFIVNTVEEEEVLRFLKFKKIYEYWYYWDYLGHWEHCYDIKLSRQVVIQKTKERFYSRNLQFYTKMEISKKFLELSSGIGLDIVFSKRKIKKNKTIQELLPWVQEITDIIEQETNRVQTNLYFRPFVFSDMQISIIKELKFGLQIKFFFSDKEFNYQKDFLLPLNELVSDNWTIGLSKSSLLFFLNFSF